MVLAAPSPPGPWSAWWPLAPWTGRVRNLKDLRCLERDDLRRREKQARLEEKLLRKQERAERWRERWPRWTAWWEKRAGEIKIAAMVAGGAATIVTSVTFLAGKASALWHEVGHGLRRGWSFYADRDVGKPSQPRRDGERLGADRIEKPRSP